MTVRLQYLASPNSLFYLFDSIWQDDEGQDIVEYALIALAMGLSTVAGVHGLANSIVSDLNIIVSGFKTATGT